MRQASRRAFLRTAVVVSTAAAVPVAAAGSAGAATPWRRPARLRRSTFAPHVGSSFLLATRGGTVYRAVLTSVTGPSQTQFALTFRIAGAARPAPGTFTLRHKRLRRVSLYMGAVAERERGLYEAVVNS